MADDEPKISGSSKVDVNESATIDEVHKASTPRTKDFCELNDCEQTTVDDQHHLGDGANDPLEQAEGVRKRKPDEAGLPEGDDVDDGNRKRPYSEDIAAIPDSAAAACLSPAEGT